MVVDGDFDVVFLDELLDPLSDSGVGSPATITCDARALAVFEFAADIFIVVFWEEMVPAAWSLMPAAA